MKNTIKYMLLTGIVVGSFSITGCKENDGIDGVKVTSMVFGNVSEGNRISLLPGDTWKAEISLMPEESTDKDEYSYKYTSSNDDIFTVDENGTVTAISEGEATLTAWSLNNTDMWASCIIEVNKKIYSVASIEVSDEYRNMIVAKGVNIKLGEQVSVLPENAWNTDVTYTTSDPNIVYTDNYGNLVTRSTGNATITINSNDGSGVSAEVQIHVRDISGYNDFDRSDWSVTASHKTATDDKKPEEIKGTPEALIDDDLISCLSLVKPGKSWAIDNITVGKDEVVYFIIDMKTEKTFDFFRLRHRTEGNTSSWIRVNKVSVYGSNDGQEFVPIMTDVDIATKNVNEVTVPMAINQTFRYFKMTYDGWESSGSTMQISDFNIGKLIFEE